MKIGVICPSEIAYRRFMPALQKCDNIEFAGVASANAEEWFGSNYELVDEKIRKEVLHREYEKAKSFVDNYGGKVYGSYTELIKDDTIEAVYIPLPPALHYKWAKLALEEGKHVFVEKPSTTNKKDTEELIAIAKEKDLAIHENYMFAFHDQLSEIKKIVDSKEIGDVRLYRIAFGFPRRLSTDFRYAKALGGGALLDCGGYTLKYASMLLGESARIAYAQLNYIDDFEVDVYGSAALINDSGDTVQVSFGMDNSYKCDLEVWGSQGCLNTGRVLTAPAGFEPTCTITKNQDKEERKLPADDTFYKSLKFFEDCISDKNIRVKSYNNILRQIYLVDDFMKKVEENGKKCEK